MLIGTCAGGYLALVSYHDSAQLSVGEIRMSIDPGHRGALDVYVPLVDWGARFEAIRAPLRLRVDLQTVDRNVAQGLAEGASLDINRVRNDAEKALRGYLMRLIGADRRVLARGSACSSPSRSARAAHGCAGRRRSRCSRRWRSAWRWSVLVPPRGEISDPQYYAHGPDIPRALEAVEAARRTSGVLDQELDSQLVGLARLVVDPGRRALLDDQPVITVAGDLHNNTVGVDLLDRLADDSPVFFTGDLTDRGSPFETRLVQRAAKAGSKFVFVSGNHDSDFSSRELVREGAIVLTRTGRLDRDGNPTGPVINKINDLRVAGYDDPYERRMDESYADRYEPVPDPVEQEKFLGWLQPLIGKVDIVMVHEPVLIEAALEVLRDAPPARPLVFLVGHTHKPDLQELPGVTVINGGSMGAGGTGNLTEDTQIGIARFIYTVEPSFQPLAADTVSIDPGTGSSSARRVRLG